jgi:hypothetical protein
MKFLGLQTGDYVQRYFRTPEKWTGRKGWNLRILTEFTLWKNTYCGLKHTAGYHADGNKYWEIYQDEICGAVLHTKKEIKEHAEWHKYLESIEVAKVEEPSHLEVNADGNVATVETVFKLEMGNNDPR